MRVPRWFRLAASLTAAACFWGVASASFVELSADAPSQSAVRPAGLPDRLTNEEFWKLSQSLSETDGFFRSDNLVSNEIWFQYIIPELQQIVKPGRAYLGVGPEQNFTYIAALKPKMVFILDVRRGNLHMHLLYKALFELSKNRVDFVSRLFSRPRPAGVDETASARELFNVYGKVAPSKELYEGNLKAIQDHLTKVRGLPLSPDDLGGIEYIYSYFHYFGPNLSYNSSSGGGRGRGSFVTYGDLMVSHDAQGVERSYLANEELFGYLKALHAGNLLVPVVGNFGGSRAIRAVGAWLRERGAVVSAFYLSNVEQYLTQDSLWQSFCNNVSWLPLDETSTFIYSDRGSGGGRGGGLGSWYRPIQDDVRNYNCK